MTRLISPALSNRWLRLVPQDYPLVTLGGFFKFWAVVYFVFTIWLAWRNKEEVAAADDPDMDVVKVYKVMWSIVKLPSEFCCPSANKTPADRHADIQSFIVMHLVSKIGFQVHEITNLKLIEKGLRKEDLALTSLLDFPCQIVGGWLAADWSRGERPLKAWERAYWARLAMAIVACLLVWAYPNSDGAPIGGPYFAAVVAVTVAASFTRCVVSTMFSVAV